MRCDELENFSTLQVESQEPCESFPTSQLDLKTMMNSTLSWYHKAGSASWLVSWSLLAFVTYCVCIKLFFAERIGLEEQLNPTDALDQIRISIGKNISSETPLLPARPVNVVIESV